MDEEELLRRAAALRSIYRARDEELSEIESKVLADHLGSKPAKAAIICGVLAVGLLAFLVWRFFL